MTEDRVISLRQEWSLYLNFKGLKLIALHGIKDGKCTCGRQCNSPGKHPIGNGWQLLTTAEAIRQFWHLNPYANFGVITENLVVVDVDERNGGLNSYEQFLKPLLCEVRTFTVRTGSGNLSRHIYLSDAVGSTKSRTGIYPGIDVKAGERGYVVGPYSRHISGNLYEVTDLGGSPDISFAEISETSFGSVLLENRRSLTKDERKANLIFGGTVVEGSRNDTLTSYAGSLWREGKSFDQLLVLLSEKNRTFSPPLPEDEVLGIAKSITSRYPQGQSKLDWELPVYDYKIREIHTPILDVGILPDYFQEYVQKKRMQVGVPAAAIMVALLTSISAILGSRFRVQPNANSDFSVALNLWGIVIAPSSARKSSVINILKTDFAQIDKVFVEARKRWGESEKKEAARIKVKLKEKDLSCLEKEQLEVELSLSKERVAPKWVFYTSDTTQESMGELFRDNRRGILLLKDELGGLFDIFSKQGYESLRSFLTESWNGGQSYRFSRVQRGIIDIPSITLSVLGCVQPDVLSQSFSQELKNGKSGDGFLARFQLCSLYGLSDLAIPDPKVEIKKEEREISAIIMGLHGLTSEFNMSTDIEPIVLKLTPDASIHYETFCASIQKFILDDEDENPAYSSHLGKFGKLVLSLSGQFHVVESLLSNRDYCRPIESQAVLNAIKLAEFFSGQVKSLYRDLSAHKGAKTMISRIKTGDISDGMSIRAIQRKGWSGLNYKEDVLNAIEFLEDSKWIKIVMESPRGGGRPTEIVKLNPNLKNYFKSKMTKLTLE